MRVQANVSTAAESFQIPACPDLIPAGPWKKVEGGVCAAKGFKATGTLLTETPGTEAPVSSSCWLCIVQHRRTVTASLNSRSFLPEQSLFACAGVYASLRASGRKADLSLVVADEPAVAAGCFTKNVMCAAPVLYCKEVLDRKQKIKAVRGGANNPHLA